MARNRRLDYPDALHHVIARGNNRDVIFKNDVDRRYFLKKLGEILLSTDTRCYAWALMPNHFHLLLRRTKVPISKIMHRLLTSYATYFNNKYKHVGHLFQNRFKSILCQDDTYFLTLIKYIHLNPMKAKIVKNLACLELYPWTGHQGLVSAQSYEWHDTETVLQVFANDPDLAVKKYLEFICVQLTQEQVSEIKHGTMVKLKNGRWGRACSLTRNQIDRSNELILGDEYFVRAVLAFNKKLDICLASESPGLDFPQIVEKAAVLFDIDSSRVLSKCRKHATTRARALISYWCLYSLGYPVEEIAQQLSISLSTVYRMALKGRDMVRSNSSLVLDKQ